MKQPTLYLMLGYPGAGKTTIAKMIHDVTGATHLWADKERRSKFSQPSYSHQENVTLYNELNRTAEQMLSGGKSVVFDTSFNFYKDREHLREIAKQHNAETILVWLTTPKEVARERATNNAHLQATRVLGNIPPEAFDRMSRDLEPPHTDEQYLEIDGTNVTQNEVRQLLTNHT